MDPEVRESIGLLLSIKIGAPCVEEDVAAAALRVLLYCVTTIEDLQYSVEKLRDDLAEVRVDRDRLMSIVEHLEKGERGE